MTIHFDNAIMQLMVLATISGMVVEVGGDHDVYTDVMYDCGCT